VANLPRIELWKMFCKSFSISDEGLCLTWENSLLWRNLYRLNGLLTKPLRLIDYRVRFADAVDEIENAVSALRDFAATQTPLEKQAALRRLFSTEYPLEVVEALLMLSNLQDIPRSCEIQTKPKGNASREVKDRFKLMDGHRFTSERGFPPPARYDSTKETERKFDPANLAFSGTKPRVKKITLFKEPGITPSGDSTGQKSNAAAPVLSTKIAVSKISGKSHLNVYVKLEQAGRLQLAKLKLIEDVIDVPVAPDGLSASALDRANFVIKLSGPGSLLTNVMSEESLASGGEFRLTLAISANGLIWSDEKSLEFRIEGGELKAR
jgi:hypothetical protein